MKEKKQIYNTLIIGAGSIGALKPDKFDSPKTKNILTHAHAITQHKRTSLFGIVEPDPEKNNMAVRKWDTSGFIDISTAQWFMQKTHIDIHIVIISTPTPIHYDTVKEVLEKIKPGLIVLEKPAGINLPQCNEIADLCKKHKTPIAVHYNRRYNAVIQAIAYNIRSGLYGDVYHATAKYDRGLLRDGSHAIDLFNYFFGSCYVVNYLNKDFSINDYSKNDLTRGVSLQYEHCPIALLLPSDGRKYSMFEIEIFTEKAKIILFDHGMSVAYYYPEKEKTFGNYNSMSDKPTIKKTNLDKSMLSLVDNCVDFLDGNDMLLCTITNALDVHIILHTLQ